MAPAAVCSAPPALKINLLLMLGRSWTTTRTITTAQHTQERPSIRVDPCHTFHDRSLNFSSVR
jgi:hypothetical protein